MTNTVLGFRHFDGALMTQFSRAASEAFDRDYWVVTKPFMYYLTDRTLDEKVIIPEGFLTDGATVPRLFWWLIPPWSDYGQAVVLHDYLCEYLTLDSNQGPIPITRERCDEILNEAMGILEVPTWKRFIIYRAVCLYRILKKKKKPSHRPIKVAFETALRARKKTTDYYI